MVGGPVASDGVLSDEAEAVRRAYERVHARLWRAVLAYSRSRYIADDAVAEAFAQALRRGGAIRDIDRWVWSAAFAIARGHLADHARGAASSAPFEEAYEGAEATVDLLDALAALPPGERELLILCDYAGLPPSEVARVAGAPSATIRVRLFRARRRARALLEEEKTL
jgi:RNA polymerase sigma-70 factor (ECF subfamily)